ncbi:unnamed protein product [Notodromas monacha]|uniref:NECAP PHear domain-containing protein n=1 Tax=Notodromas monacha TaxID=399045 RepID=A0A7R9GED1_9CRUS|nr:unnamed protein product [Notodromas monacha]CAG0919495.1 unnamed protein product [Notodromas monacha]
MDEYESILLVKNEVLVYNIPPRQSTARGYRASDWNLAVPDWTGRMRLVAKMNAADCVLKLEDKLSGELFAKCPIDAYPGLSVQPVTDSSRYFVIHIKDDSGQKAYIGIGFADRSDSFDLNVALQDHFKYLKKCQDSDNAPEEDVPQLDLKFKEGQTINIKMNLANPSKSEKTRVKGTGGGILPPPPGGIKLPPPPGGVGSPSHKPTNDLFGELGSSGSASSNPFAATGGDDWGEFSGISSSTRTSTTSAAPAANTSSWVQF